MGKKNKKINKPKKTIDTKKIIMICGIAIVLILGCVVGLSLDKDVVYTDNFESISSWDIYDYEKDYMKNDVSKITLVEEGYNDNSSVRIESTAANDVRLYKKLKVEPDANYKISMKVNANCEEGIGASISGIRSYYYSNVLNTNDSWNELEMYIKTNSDQEEIEFCFGIGGYSNVSKGYAYFDDLKIEKVADVIGKNVVTMTDDTKHDNANEVTEYKSYTWAFILLMGIVIVLSIYTGIKAKNQKQEDVKLTKKDYIIMLILTVICGCFSFYKLGNLYGPTTYWKAGMAGDYVVIEFPEMVTITSVAHNGNVPDDGYYKIKYQTEEDPFLYKDAFTIGENVTDSTGMKIKKSTFFCWQFNDVLNFSTRRIKVESAIPGWGINELAFYTRNISGEDILLDFEIVDSYKSPATDGLPENIFDEQEMIPERYGYMNSTYFDELYFSRTAYEHLKGWSIYETTHPPLGKIIISIGIVLFGMNPLGWRVMGTLCGVLFVPLMYLFAHKIFKKRAFAFITAFLIMFDFMRLAQTRLGTIDSYSSLWVLCMYYFMYDYFMSDKEKKPLLPLFFSGLFFGIGAATKWSCFYAGGGLAFIFFLTKYLEFREMNKYKKAKEWFVKDFIPTCLWCVLFFVIIPLMIYVLSYIPYLPSMPDSNLIEIVVWNFKSILDYHSNLSASHPYESPWYTWPFNIKPLWLCSGGTVGDQYSTIVTFGNPAVWLVSFLAVIISTFFIWKDKDKKGALLLIAYAFQYFPWILITRIAFIYSYFTALPFAILLLVYCMDKINNEKVWPKVILAAYLILVFVLFIMFYPVLTGIMANKAYITSLHWLTSWVF